jgi:hypothetical protein
MRVLLDECVTRRLRHDFVGHTVSTVEEAGLKGLQNGPLVRAAAGPYEVLITVDQNLRGLPLAILVLVARRNTYTMLHPLMPQVLQVLERIRPGEVVRIEPAP